MQRKPAEVQLTVDASSLSWRPALEGERAYRFRIEKASSGRAECRACGLKIEKGALRCGTPIKWRQFISSWQHLECFWAGESAEPIDFDAGEVYGLSTLDASQVVYARDQMAKTCRPEHIEVFDLAAEAAAKSPPPKEPVAKRETPEAMTISLLPFQEESLGWMLHRERMADRGGILADEMGMGACAAVVLFCALTLAFSLQARRFR
jgi:hypothetical protein